MRAFLPCLQEAGIDPASPRHTWPLPKLVRVLRSMQQSGERRRRALSGHVVIGGGQKSHHVA